MQNKNTVETKIKEGTLNDFDENYENRTFSDDSLQKYFFGIIELQKSIIQNQQSRINDLESKIIDFGKSNDELKKLESSQVLQSPDQITSENNYEILKDIQKQIAILKPQGDIENYPAYLTLEQATKLLTISKRKFQEFVKNGVLPSPISAPNSNKLNGGKQNNIGRILQRWDKSELLEWWHGYKSI